MEDHMVFPGRHHDSAHQRVGPVDGRTLPIDRRLPSWSVLVCQDQKATAFTRNVEVRAVRRVLQVLNLPVAGR